MKQGNDRYPTRDDFDSYCIGGNKENNEFNATHIEFYGVDDGPLDDVPISPNTIKLELEDELSQHSQIGFSDNDEIHS